MDNKATPKFVSKFGGGRLIKPVRFEHVMNIIPVCKEPEFSGPRPQAPDGLREDNWPVVSGTFEGINGLRGKILAGGGDWPVVRPDGAVWLSAVYRMVTDDGFTIYIDNKGFWEEGKPCRLHPEFRVAKGPHDWLNRSIFVGNLVDVPKDKTLITPANMDQNERLVQVFRVV